MQSLKASAFYEVLCEHLPIFKDLASFTLPVITRLYVSRNVLVADKSIRFLPYNQSSIGITYAIVCSQIISIIKH